MKPFGMASKSFDRAPTRRNGIIELARTSALDNYDAPREALAQASIRRRPLPTLLRERTSPALRSPRFLPAGGADLSSRRILKRAYVLSIQELPQ